MDPGLLRLCGTPSCLRKQASIARPTRWVPPIDAYFRRHDGLTAGIFTQLRCALARRLTVVTDTGMSG
jgi:hypothetical protein